MDVWNGLSEEIVTAASVQKFKEMLDIYRYRDRTMSPARALYNTTS